MSRNDFHRYAQMQTFSIARILPNPELRFTPIRYSTENILAVYSTKNRPVDTVGRFFSCFHRTFLFIRYAFIFSKLSMLISCSILQLSS